jgi:phage tail sheath gpL-like
MATVTLGLTHAKADNFRANTGQGFRDVISRVLQFFGGVASGSFGATSLRMSTSAASGTLTLSGASGTVGGVINGVTLTVAFDTDDATTASALADEINASDAALVEGLVTASADGAVVTLTAVDAGVTGNCITLAASGTGVTASGARLTGGTTTTLTK